MSYPLTVVSNRPGFEAEAEVLGRVINRLYAEKAVATDAGIYIRAVRMYDPHADRLISRLDVLYGYGFWRREFAVRVGDEDCEGQAIEVEEFEDELAA